MRIDTRLGTYDQIRALEPRQAPTLDAIRALVAELHPDAMEVARPGDRAVNWGWGPKKMSEAYCHAVPYAGYVNLGFYYSPSLPDPERLLQGTGARIRHVKLHSPEDVGRPAIRALLTAAIAERRAALKL